MVNDPVSGNGWRGRRRIFSVFVVAILVQPIMTLMANAQSLDELIPDEAVENPEAWAGQGSLSAAADSEPAEESPESADMSEPQIDLPLVATDELEEFELADTYEPFEFTDFGTPDTSSLVDLETVHVARGLELGIPVDRTEFPERENFIRRFSALSTLNELGNSNGGLAQVAVRVAEDEALLGDLLRLYGYYGGSVAHAIEVENGASPNNTANVRFDIQPGRQFSIGSVDLGQLTGVGADFDLLHNAFGVRSGDPARTDLIVEGQARLMTALGENGYVFANIDDPQLTVDHLRSEADLEMPVSPNGKYRIAGVVSGSPELLSSRHLASLALFDPGDTYRESEIQDLRQMILATGLASRVSISPRETIAPQGAEPGTVDIDVAVDPAPLRTIRAGIGYGTGEGYRVSGSWQHRNLFPPEGMLMARSILGTREMLAGVTFQRNNLGGRHRVLTLDTSVGQEDRDAYNARTVTFLANYELKSTPFYSYKFTWGLGTELLATEEREIDSTGVLTARQDYLVGAFPLHALLDTSDDLLDPTEGFRLGLKVSPELSLQGTNATSYVRARWDGSVYHRVGGGTVMAARGAVGSIIGASTDAIAPSRRFYAGGGSSIRGYGFEKVGVADNLDDTIGGRSVAEFSLEARIPTSMFDGALSLVPFVDGGAVYRENIPAFDHLRFGAGLGFRYETLIGPFRVDIATPLNPRPQDSKVAVYLSLGQAF